MARDSGALARSPGGVRHRPAQRGDRGNAESRSAAKPWTAGWLSSPRVPLQAGRRATAERRSPTGIARERETCGYDAGPGQHQFHTTFFMRAG